MSKEIPILFSSPMVQAILAGRKTMTRRLVKFPLKCPTHQISIGESDHAPIVEWAKWQPGDIIWVRESWSPKYVKGCLEEFKIVYPNNYPWIYKADNSDQKQGYAAHAWKPSIHMPRAAARIWLEVTGITVERLQDISTDDITNEGVRYAVEKSDIPGMVHPCFKLGHENSALSFMPENWKDLPEDKRSEAILYAHWAELWCEINGRQNWDTNPWVWCIEFKVLSTTGKPMMSKQIELSK